MADHASFCPVLRACLQVKDRDRLGDGEFWDVKFFPYGVSKSEPPVFAATGCNSTTVCKVVSAKSTRIETLRWWEETKSQDGSPNSISWLLDPSTLQPLLCSAGGNRQINVHNVTDGTLMTTLTGHGGCINDLQTHPVSPHVLASASEDHTVRFWDIRCTGRPCVMVSGAAGHSAGLITMAFHNSGKYMVSAGFDSRINLWALPNVDEYRGSDDITCLIAPHFTTTQLHTNYVDCIVFYGDCIISKSADSRTITLWKINGFDASNATPPADAAVPCGIGALETLSAFGSGFQVLLTFGHVHCKPYWIRFGLFQKPSNRPILALGNHKGIVSFWDLESIEEMAGATGHQKSETSTRPLIDPYRQVNPHHSDRQIQKHSRDNFCARGVGWSSDGEWCVVGGSQGSLYLFSI